MSSGIVESQGSESTAGQKDAGQSRSKLVQRLLAGSVFCYCWVVSLQESQQTNWRMLTLVRIDVGYVPVAVISGHNNLVVPEHDLNLHGLWHTILNRQTGLNADERTSPAAYPLFR